MMPRLSGENVGPAGLADRAGRRPQRNKQRVPFEQVRKLRADRRHESPVSPRHGDRTPEGQIWNSARILFAGAHDAAIVGGECRRVRPRRSRRAAARLSKQGGIRAGTRRTTRWSRSESRIGARCASTRRRATSRNRLRPSAHRWEVRHGTRRGRPRLPVSA